ncbi:MAG TPA: PilZ domain-containing protein [Tepidisphaeraceae bacterium]|nr:PilZ domain-containing protein [Tepidisphaeraceae bacterium]
MELPLELFEEITGLLGPATVAPDTESDRRKFRRFPFGSRAMLVPIRKGVEGPHGVALLRDISLSGIGFLHSDAMKPGDLFNLHLTGKEGRIIHVQCSARHCETGGSLEGTQYVIGANFEQVLKVEEPHDENEHSPAIPRPPAQFPARKPAAAPAAQRAATQSTPAAQTAPQPAAAAPAVAEPNNAQADREKQIAAFCESPSAEAEIAEVELIPDDEAAKAQPAEAAPKATVALEPNPAPAPESTPPPDPAPAPAPAPVAVPQRAAVSPAPQPDLVPPPMAVMPPTAVGTPEAKGKNQELLSRVKAMVLDQKNVLQTYVDQVEKAKRELEAQKIAMAELTRQRNELQAQLAHADQFLTEQKQKAAEAVEATAAMTKDLSDMQQIVRTLQAKSDSDDKAIAELAALIGVQSNSASGAPPPAAPKAAPPVAPNSSKPETMVATLAVDIPTM